MADAARWNKLQLIVHRNASGTLSWAVLHRDVAGALVKDVRVASGTIPCPPGSSASQDPMEALEAALDSWRTKPWHR